MEQETRIVFKGKLSEFSTWFEVMKERYKNANIEAVLEDFDCYT